MLWVQWALPATELPLGAARVRGAGCTQEPGAPCPQHAQPPEVGTCSAGQQGSDQVVPTKGC